MFERFTEQAIKVMMLAQEEARRLGHNFVGTEQILLGLISESQGIAARVLGDVNVPLDHARTQVETIIGRGSGFVATEIPFTPRAKRILELSVQEAQQFGHSHIGTEHLLLGLVQEGGGVAVRVLNNLGVEVNRLRQRVLQYLGVNNAEPQVLPSTILEALQAEPELDLAEGATKVILLAQEETQRAQLDVLGTEQILLGLVAESVGWAAQQLRMQNLTLKKARATVKAIVGQKTATTTALSPAFSPKAEAVLQTAIVYARDRNHDLLDTAHLLLGLIDQSDCVAIRVLDQAGLDCAQLREAALNCLANPHSGKRSSPEARLLDPMQQKLREALQSDQTAIQQQALNALAIVGSEIHVTDIAVILQSGSPALRIAAIAALEAIGGASALAALTALTQEHDPRIRWRVEQAIAQIKAGERPNRAISLPPVDPNGDDLVLLL